MHHSRLLTAACLSVALAVPTLEASECISMSARTMKKEAGLVFEVRSPRWRSLRTT